MENLLISTPILLLIIAWTLPWKGVALWRAAKNNQLNWFIVLLVFNTLAILEIIYIFYFSKRSKKNKVLTKSGSCFSKKIRMPSELHSNDTNK